MHIGHVLTAIDDFWNTHSALINTLQYDYQEMKLKYKDTQRGKLNPNINNTSFDFLILYIFFKQLRTLQNNSDVNGNTNWTVISVYS